MPRSRHRENKQIIHHLQKSLCGPERRYEELDHSCWEVRVVQKEGMGNWTTVSGELVWSRTKKSRTRPQPPKSKCGPKRRYAKIESILKKYLAFSIRNFIIVVGGKGDYE